jgi:hypothetical protein
VAVAQSVEFACGLKATEFVFVGLVSNARKVIDVALSYLRALASYR